MFSYDRRCKGNKNFIVVNGIATDGQHLLERGEYESVSGVHVCSTVDIFNQAA
jgi:hypothetical protein